MEDQLLSIQHRLGDTTAHRRTEQQLSDIRDKLAATDGSRAHMEKQLAQLLQRSAAQAGSTLSPTSNWGCMLRDTGDAAAHDRKRLKERLKKAVMQARLPPIAHAAP